MQLSYFTNGGYVVHKALSGNVSAWFDEWGVLVDAEQFDRLKRSRQVKKGSAAWVKLQSAYGKRQNFEDWNEPFCIRAR